MRTEIRILDLENDGEIARCFPVFSILRPHLDQAGFIDQVRAQSREGYKIVYIERADRVAAAAGYRVGSFLAWGKILYIDDLTTHPEQRKRGLASSLLDWLFNEAARLGCAQIHLDSGHQRHDAHRLYLNKGFVLSSHHFCAKLR